MCMLLAMGGGYEDQRIILGNQFSSSRWEQKLITPREERHQSRAVGTGEEIHVHRLEDSMLLCYQLFFQLIYRVNMTTAEIQQIVL